MRSFVRMSVGLGLALALGAACSDNTGPSQGSGEGGRPGSGGSAAGGASATGGAQSNGGTSGNGGVSGAGGSSGSGGKSGAGGAAGSGGTTTPPGTGGKNLGGATVAAGGAAGGSVGGSVGPDAGAGGKVTGGAGGSSPGSGGAGSGGSVAIDGGGKAGAPGNVYNPDFKEFYGDDCTVPDPKDVSVSTLNDLFLGADGSTRMSKKSDWRCQRAFLKKVMEKYVHGEKPPKPEKVTGSVSSSAIKVHVENKGKSIDFSVPVTMPGSGSGPVPIIIGMGGSSLDASIVKGEGVASGTFDHQSMASETSRSGLFTTIYGSNGISAQIGWAWGISRVIDVLVDEKAAGRNNIIDPTAVGVTGCSRNGKAAFNVGAWDERIALGIPQESGTGGVSAFRIVNTNPQGPNGKGAQTLDSAWSEAQGWFGSVFSTYKGKVNSIPGDTHAIAAMYAPRGLLVLDNSRIGELCATCQHGASAAAAKVYEALGVGKNIEYNGGNPSDPHNHCTFYSATQGDPLKRAIRAFLTKKADPDGRIVPQPAGTADLTKWIPWTAPALADDTSFASPPVTK
jgi:hypothetical protein